MSAVPSTVNSKVIGINDGQLLNGRAPHIHRIVVRGIFLEKKCPGRAQNRSDAHRTRNRRTVTGAALRFLRHPSTG